MSNQSLCERLRNLLNDQRNELMAIHIRFFSAGQERDRLQRLVDDLENQVRNAQARAVAGQAVRRALGPGGFAVAALSKLESDIRIGRLEEELARVEADLASAERHFENVEDKIRELEGSIPTTENDLLRYECD